MQKFFRYCEKIRMGIECTDREAYFHDGLKEIYDRIFYTNKISVLWMRSGTLNRCPIKIISLTDSLASHLCGDP